MYARLAFILLLTGVVATPAHACTCIPNPPPHEALNDADGVFVADVLDLDRVDGDLLASLRVKLRLIRTFKGNFGETETVRTARDGASCGFPFRRGERYLVYLHRVEGVLLVSLCSRTAALADATEDLVAFDADDLVGTHGEHGRSRRCGGPTNAATLQGMVFVFLGLLLRRRPW